MRAPPTTSTPRSARDRAPRGPGLSGRHHLSLAHRRRRLLLGHRQAERVDGRRAGLSDGDLRGGVGDGGQGGRHAAPSSGSRRHGTSSNVRCEEFRVALRRRAARDPRRGQQPRPRVPGCGRHAVLRGARPRARASWTSTATPTSTSSARGGRSSSATPPRRWSRRSSRPRGGGTSYGAPTRARGRAGRDDLARRAVDGDGAARVLGHGGGDERDPARARRHRARRHRQVRRAATTATPTACSSRRARAARRSACPTASGCRAALAALTLTLPFNDLARGRRALDAHPAASRGGHRGAGGRQHGRGPARAGLSRRACASSARATARCCIFDEVITGFRVAFGGAQARYGVRPDLTCLGKIIGGGLPVGAYGGPRELMEQVAPLGTGVPGGHAVGQSARRRRGARDAPGARAPGDATSGSSGWARDSSAGSREAARATGVPVTVNRVGSHADGVLHRRRR